MEAAEMHAVTLPAALTPLVAEKRWVVWKWETTDKGKQTKTPYQAARPSAKASSTNPRTWSDYQTAARAVAGGQADGIGYALDGGEIGAFDIDNCRDRETHEISEWALPLIEAAASYTEVTVSGTGLRIIGRAVGNHIHRNQAVPGAGDGRIETYRKAERYIVVTGDQLEGTADSLTSLDATMDATVASLDSAAARAKDERRQADTEARRPTISERASAQALSSGPDMRPNLPRDLESLIRYGAPAGADRSTEFHHVVGWLKDYGHSPSDIEATLAAHPHGIAEKYAGRLGAEVERCFQKCESKPIQHRDSRLERRSAPEPPPFEAPPFEARPFVWKDPTKIPLREWLLGRHLIRRFTSVTAAPGGLGKSFLEIADALAMATGRNLIGHEPHGRFRVLMWNGEDPLDELGRRIMAACLHYKITEDQIQDHLFVNSGRDDPIVIAEQKRDGVTVAVPVVEAIKATIRKNNIDVVIIDPFVSCHSVNENDNGAIDRVAKLWGKIADETGCAIELVHHTRKTGGNETVMEDLRGAVALLSAVRSGRILNLMSSDQADAAGVEDRRSYFRVDTGKANLAPPPTGKTTWFKLQSVDLGNGGEFFGVQAPGDSVGVVTAWEWPDPFENVTTADLRKAQTEVRATGPWRENVQAKDWVGKPIARALGLNPDDKADRQKIKGLLKIWIANGMFVVVMGTNDKNRPTPFVEVGNAASD